MHASDGSASPMLRPPRGGDDAALAVNDGGPGAAAAKSQVGVADEADEDVGDLLYRWLDHGGTTGQASIAPLRGP